MRLVDVYAGKFSPREVLSWLQHLPPEAATVLAQDPDAVWGLSEQLLAAAVDVLVWANYQQAGGKGTKPKPIPRPGVGSRSGERHGKTNLPPERAREILRAYISGRYALPTSKDRPRDARGRFTRTTTEVSDAGRP